jgi:SAM-dependent methyltransferase
MRDRMRLFSTRTTDFSDDEILRIKEHEGQIYADISTKIAPDDFAEDLRKLVLAGECAECRKRSVCGGSWEAHRAEVFSRDAARVSKILAELRGPILDIGCGDGPYAKALSGAVLSGLSAYCGLDPDASRVALLRSRYPWATYFEGTLEDYVRDERALFANVLLLRSYNHLPDPARTVELAVSLLAEGGKFLVVDNVAFGLVRSMEQSMRAEQGPAEFEHYRNASAEEAAKLILRPSLRLVEERSITPLGSNEWLLLYEKIGKDA